MTNEQLYLAIRLPIIFNTIIVMVGILITNRIIGKLRNGLYPRIHDLRSHLDQRFEDFREFMDAKFATAHAELIRVEQAMDARLKHLENR